MEEAPIPKSSDESIPSEIQLNPENLFFIQDPKSKEYKLKIKINIGGKEQNFYTTLEENKNIKSELEEMKKQNAELKEIIKYKEEKIKILEEKLQKYIKMEKEKEEKEKIFMAKSNLKTDNLYDDFDIKLKDPLHMLNTHTGDIRCLIVLNDGRLASCSGDNTIVIYNKLTYNPDLIIKEHNNSVNRIIQLSSGILASCSHDNTIKFFNIKGKDYEIIQNLTYHTSYVYKIIELSNKYLVSCSWDKSIIFYFKDNKEYKKDYQLSLGGECENIIQTKDNEICYSERKNKICFFDLLERKIKANIDNIREFSHYFEEWFLMITKDLLLIPGDNKMFIINVNHYKLVREINVDNAGFIYSGCLLNKNILITGDSSKTLRQWRIEDDNLILTSKKENSHGNSIISLAKLGNGHIATGSTDKTIKYW